MNSRHEILTASVRTVSVFVNLLSECIKRPANEGKKEDWTQLKISTQLTND